jgi:hypothetical protein
MKAGACQVQHTGRNIVQLLEKLLLGVLFGLFEVDHVPLLLNLLTVETGAREMQFRTEVMNI